MITGCCFCDSKCRLREDACQCDSCYSSPTVCDWYMCWLCTDSCNHSCRGVQCTDCGVCAGGCGGGCGGGGDDAGAVLAIIAVVIAAIIVCLGFIVGIFVSVALGKKIIKRHMGILERKATAEDQVVEDLDGQPLEAWTDEQPAAVTTEIGLTAVSIPPEEEGSSMPP
eukprot:Colp12_sorted_trinity150504_noHs@32861